MISKKLTGALPFVAGNGIGAIATIAALFVLANNATSAQVGIYGLVGALVAVMATLLDTVTHQRVVQEHSGDRRDISSFLPARAILVGTGALCLWAIGCAVTIPLGLDPPLALAGAVYTLGQALYSVLSTNGAFLHRGRSFFWQQMRFAGALGVALGIALLSSERIDAAQVLIVVGSARIVVGVIEVVLGVFDSRRWSRPASLRMLTALLVRKDHRTSTILLAVRQAATAVSAQLDTVGASVAGLRVVGMYQLVQRPMQAFGVVSVALEQYAMRRAISNEPLRTRHIAGLGVLLLIIWPCVGLAMAYLLAPFTPDDLQPPLKAFAVLSIAYAFDGLAALLGPKLLLARLERGLAVAALTQLVTIAAAVVMLAPSLGVVGVAISVALGRISVVMVYGLLVFRMNPRSEAH